jgi:hypothetical protein
VAQACNPSYLGGRDQENLGSKPDPANISQDPIKKKKKKRKITKKFWFWWNGSSSKSAFMRL